MIDKPYCSSSPLHTWHSVSVHPSIMSQLFCLPTSTIRSATPASSNVTKPKPRLSPVTLSRIMIASFTRPYTSKHCRNPRSVVSQLKPPTKSLGFLLGLARVEVPPSPDSGSWSRIAKSSSLSAPTRFSICLLFSSLMAVIYSVMRHGTAALAFFYPPIFCGARVNMDFPVHMYFFPRIFRKRYNFF